MRRVDDQNYTLASNLSATGPSTQVRGGTYAFTAEGVVGGATVSLQMQTMNGTWVNVATPFNNVAVSTTALPYMATGIKLPAGNYRMAVSGGSPSGLFAYLHGLG